MSRPAMSSAITVAGTSGRRARRSRNISRISTAPAPGSAAGPAGGPGIASPFSTKAATRRERRDALRRALAERGLSSAYVTVDSYDWYLESLTNRAVRAGQTIDRDALRQLYVDAIVGAAEFSDRIAVETLGRSPAHVLLLHETDLAALFIADAVAELRRRGWRIVSADEAFRDPIAGQEPDSMFLGGGRIAGIANARGRERRELVPQWNEEAYLTTLFNQRVLHQRATP